MSSPETETESTDPLTMIETGLEIAPLRSTRRRRTKLERRICFLQTSNKPMVPKRTFSGVLDSMLRDLKSKAGFRLSKNARTMLQTDTEYMMSMLFAKAKIIANQRHSQTVCSTDLRAAIEVSSSSFTPEGI